MNMKNNLNGLTNVNIELTNKCNKCCWMCGRRKIENIKSFQFNKNKIVIDTVFLDQSFSMLKEIDIDAPKIEERDYNAYMTRRIGNSSYSVGLMSITQMEYKLSPAELSKLIPPIIDPSPRNTQNDLKPGATPFLQ